MTGPMEESDENIEARLGMTLEQARDTTAMTYINVYLRLMARELGVPVLDDAALQAHVPELTTGLNAGMQIAWCVFVEDKVLANQALEELRAIVDGIPEKTS